MDVKIDEAAFSRMLLGRGYPENGDEPRGLRELIEAYLAALPSAEPGRDRIAVVVNRDGHGIGWLLGDMDEAEIDWPFIERASLATGPFAHLIVHCDLGRPEKAKTVKGTVEEVVHD